MHMISHTQKPFAQQSTIRSKRAGEGEERCIRAVESKMLMSVRGAAEVVVMKLCAEVDALEVGGLTATSELDDLPAAGDLVVQFVL